MHTMATSSGRTATEARRDAGNGEVQTLQVKPETFRYIVFAIGGFLIALGIGLVVYGMYSLGLPNALVFLILVICGAYLLCIPWLAGRKQRRAARSSED